jgi:hypothetical protein
MSSEILDPFYVPQAWDVVVIGGVVSPGVCKVGEFKRTHEWDIKKGKGTVGATVTFVGRPPAKGTIDFQLWTRDHFVQWGAFRPILKYDPTKKSVQAVDIYHPSLADIDINSVVVEEIGNIVHEGNGLYSVKLSLLEYFPPPKLSSVSTPTGAAATASGAGNTPGAAPPAAQDQYQTQIAQLMKEAQAP